MHWSAPAPSPLRVARSLGARKAASFPRLYGARLAAPVCDKCGFRDCLGMCPEGDPTQPSSKEEAAHILQNAFFELAQNDCVAPAESLAMRCAPPQRRFDLSLRSSAGLSPPAAKYGLLCSCPGCRMGIGCVVDAEIPELD